MGVGLGFWVDYMTWIAGRISDMRCNNNRGSRMHQTNQSISLLFFPCFSRARVRIGPAGVSRVGLDAGLHRRLSSRSISLRRRCGFEAVRFCFFRLSQKRVACVRSLPFRTRIGLSRPSGLFPHPNEGLCSRSGGDAFVFPWSLGGGRAASLVGAGVLLSPINSSSLRALQAHSPAHALHPFYSWADTRRIR